MTRVSLYCGARAWGGAEIFLGRLLAELGPGFEPSLVGVDAEVLARVASYRPGVPVALVPEITDKRDVGAFRAQRRALAAQRPEVVHVNLPVPFAAPYTVVAALSVPRTTVVAVEHLPMPIPSRGIRLLTRVTARRLDAHVAVGTAAAREVERMSGLRTGAVRVIPNGVPLPGPTASVARPTGDFLVGGVGRLHAQKGFDVLVRAVARVSDVHLVLVGDGPERTALEALAADVGVADRVTVTGWVPAATDWLPALDVVALPSRFEGLPLVLLEAMMQGRPVVGTTVGSMGDALRDGDTGLVVPVDDEVALAGALARLRDDPALRARLGEGARTLAHAEFSVQAMTRAYERLYAGLA